MVVRRLAQVGPEGAQEALLRYLPYAEDEGTAEEAVYGLDALTVRAMRSCCWRR